MSALNLKSIPNRIDDAGALRAFVVELFYGWGYNAYKTENKLRADDQLIRNELCGWLGQARAMLAERESAYRREALPPPTREKPFADAAAVKAAQAMERDQRLIEDLEVQIRGLSVPGDDRTWARHRNRDETLSKLRDIDLDLGAAVMNLVRQIRDAGPADRIDLQWTAPVYAALEARRAALSVFA